MKTDLTVFDQRVLKVARDRKPLIITQDITCWSWRMYPVGHREFKIGSKLFATKTQDMMSGDAVIIIEPLKTRKKGA